MEEKEWMADRFVLDIYNCFRKNTLIEDEVLDDIFARKWKRFAKIVISLLFIGLVVVVSLQQAGSRLTAFIWSLVIIGILLLAILLFVAVIGAFASWNSHLFATEKRIGIELAQLELGQPVPRNHQGFAIAMTGEYHNNFAKLYISALKYFDRVYQKFGLLLFICAFASWNYRGLLIERIIGSAHGKLPFDPAGAVADFDEALRLDSTLDITYRDRGLARAMMGQYHRAIADFDRALLGYLKRGHKKRGGYKYFWLTHRVETCYIIRGYCRHKVGLLDEAKEDLTTALNLARERRNEQLASLAEQVRNKIVEALKDVEFQSEECDTKNHLTE